MVSDNYMEKHLKQLVGKTVTGLAIDNHPDTIADFGEPVWGLQFDDGTTAFPMRDPEGNGPGYLEILKQ